MAKKKLKTGKTLRNVETRQYTLDELKNRIEADFDNPDLMLMTRSKAGFGRYENGDFVFADPLELKMADIEEMRVFDENQELYVWQRDNSLYARYRKDEIVEDDGKGIEEFVEADLVLWGTRKGKEKNGWTSLKEDRGIEFFIPVNVKKVDEQHPVKLKVRTYIEYLQEDEIQASYYDSRFVSFVEGDESV